jgi:hypothetical protein
MSLQVLRHTGPALDAPGLTGTTAARPGGPRIRCPHCGWEPRREDKWICACLHEWNTFETGGVCPTCQRQWVDTQCPSCDAWSKHLEWYVDEADPS